MESKISQFVTVTGASEDDARSLLEACAGDLDMAVNMHMESEGGGVTRNSAAGSYEALHGVRAPIPQTSGVLLEEAPTTTRSMRSRRLPASVFDPFQDYSRVTQKVDEGGKLKSLADLFKPPYDIMFVGTFEELRMAGQTKGRWLLVNVQDSKQFASQVLNRDVWSHEGVRTILLKHFLFWQIHRITDDGLRFKQLYNVESFPYIAIIDPRTGEKLLDWGAITVTKFITDLTEFLHSNAFDDDQGPSRDTKRLAEMTEEEQLEAAIKASLHDPIPDSRDYSQQNGDSDDFVSLDSGDEDEMDGCETNQMEHDAVKEDQSSETQCASNMTTDSDTNFHPMFAMNTAQLKDMARNVNLPYRKRKSSIGESVSMPSRKMPRGDTFHEVERVEHRAVLIGSEVTMDLSKQGKGKDSVVGSQRKGKDKQSPSIEEQLESGHLHKSEVSRILIRLPNGSRLHKAFLSSTPIKEFFSFLSEKGIDSSQHEIVTNFPKRSLKELNNSLTFKEADLYPSVTVFVQD